MSRLFLFYILQLLAGVSLPLHTVHYGRMTVPLVLHYQAEADSCGMPVAPGWTLRIGEAAFGREGDTLRGDGTHFWYGPHGALRQVQDDAGNCIVVSDEGVFWPRGAVYFAVSEGLVKGFTVLDADSATVGKVTFEADPELKFVRIQGHDGSETQEFKMDYDALARLQSITRIAGGSVDFSFAPAGNRLLKRSVCRKDSEGQVTGVSEYAYSSDSLGQDITETVTDGKDTLRKTVRRFAEGRLMKKEEFSGDNRLTRSTLYQYADGNKEGRLQSVTTLCYPEDSLSPPRTSVRRYTYAVGPTNPYPVEVEIEGGNGTNERLFYTYPFYHRADYGPVADSLLARGMTGTVLTASRWKDGQFVDSTAVLYDAFAAPNAPAGMMYRPSAVVYSDAVCEPEVCLKYTSYDTLGLRSDRAMTLNKRNADRLPPETFRWTATDPLTELLREQLSHDLCAAWPDVVPNAECGESFLFDGTGTYLGKVETEGPAGRIIADRGFGEPPLSAQFADTERTPLQLNPNTTLEVVSIQAMASDLSKSGAFELRNRGLIRGMWFLLQESQFGHRLDFATNSAYDIFPNTLYVTDAGPMGVIAHDNYNYGNFLWGAAAFEVGVPQWIALLGSHLNAFFSPYSFGSFDSRDDILSIRAGYHWDKK